MQIPILIEPIAENGFRAKAGEPFDFTVEGHTRDDVVRKVKELIEAKLQTPGTELVPVDVPVPANPWLRIAGSLDQNDPVVQEWLAIMAENRRKADEDPDYP